MGDLSDLIGNGRPRGHPTAYAGRHVSGPDVDGAIVVRTKDDGVSYKAKAGQWFGTLDGDALLVVDNRGDVWVFCGALGGGGSGSGNLDGGTPSSVYGGIDPVDGGVV